MARDLRRKAAQDELEAKRACAKALQSASLREFHFQAEGKTYKARLKRPLGHRVNVHKLYTLVREGVLTLDEFLDCVTANEEFVNDTLSPAQVKPLIEEYRKGLDLIITP